MADTLYTDVANNQNDPIQLTKERESDGAKVSGDVLIATATRTLTADDGDADTWNIVKLPEGACVVPHLCKVITNFGANPDLDIIVGDDDDTTAADDNRYCTTLILDGSVGTVFDFIPGVAGLTPYVLQKSSWIQAVLSGSGSLNVGDKVTFYIAYRAQS